MAIKNDVALLEAKVDALIDLFEAAIFRISFNQVVTDELQEQAEAIRAMHIDDYNGCVEYPDGHNSNWIKDLDEK